MSDLPSTSEKRDTGVRSIFLTVLVAVVIIVVLVMVLYNYVVKTRGDISFGQTTTAVTSELPELRRAEDSILNSYGVVDSAAGVYRVPIVRAMELIAVDSTGHTPSK